MGGKWEVMGGKWEVIESYKQKTEKFIRTQTTSR